MVPPWALAQILIGVAKFLPKYKLVPQKNLAEAAFRDMKHRELVCPFLNKMVVLKITSAWLFIRVGGF